MNIKVFNIRLTKEFCQTDQDRMNEFLDSVEVKLTSTNFVTTGTKDFWSAVVFYAVKTKKTEKAETKPYEEDLLPNERIIFNALRQWRYALAEKQKWPLFRICHNSQLIAVAKANPGTLQELEKMPGFGKARVEKYGNEILGVLNAL